MLKRVMICLIAAFLACAGSALADPASVVKVQDEAFAKAFEACDVTAMLDLYEKYATIIWPGEGEVATGKPAIAKVAKSVCADATKSSLTVISSNPRAIGKDYIINVGMWDYTAPGSAGKPTTSRLRTTELLHKSDGKWRYVIDHASIGLPPLKGAVKPAMTSKMHHN